VTVLFVESDVRSEAGVGAGGEGAVPHGDGGIDDDRLIARTRRSVGWSGRGSRERERGGLRGKGVGGLLGVGRLLLMRMLIVGRKKGWVVMCRMRLRGLSGRVVAV
jgi:hypothetical protein